MNTVTVDRDLLHRGVVLEEVEVHEGHIFLAIVLDDSLDTSVADLAQGDVKSRRLVSCERQSRHVLGQSQQGSGGSETHDGQETVAQEKLLFCEE